MQIIDIDTEITKSISTIIFSHRRILIIILNVTFIVKTVKSSFSQITERFLTSWIKNIQQRDVTNQYFLQKLQRELSISNQQTQLSNNRSPNISSHFSCSQISIHKSKF